MYRIVGARSLWVSELITTIPQATTSPISQPSALIHGVGLMLITALTRFGLWGVLAKRLGKKGNALRALADRLFFIMALHI
ncbi:hypothetical protein D3C73_1038980 [compost metagenome]